MPTEEKKIDKEIGYVKSREITEEMKTSYIDYAMSVIVSRALPDVRDGLKPVQRRILYTMYEMGLRPEGKFRKSATVVGGVLGRYHPHGDMPVYGALVRLGQDFSLRYPLVKPQGNFGSIDGDPPAAQRYTEAKLSRVGEELLKDIEKETVDFMSNFDGTRKEPVVLPSPLPHLLLNGALGIAVGMATSVPPHNLAEVCQAAIYLIDNPRASTEDLLEFIKGPDFPTGGIIYNKQAIISAYSQGKGPILVRGKAEIVERKGRFQIIVSEIPFGIQKSGLIQQIAKMIQTNKLKGARDIRDESDREGLRIAIDLKPGMPPQKTLNALFKYTSLQSNFHLNLIALIDGIQPKLLGLVDILSEFLEHRRQVVLKRTKFDLAKTKERAHILEGLAKALKNIDAVIKTIKASKDREEAEKNLIGKFKLTKIQANAILEMRLAALARLEREKIEIELKQAKELIKELEGIIKSPTKIKNIIKKELKESEVNFGDERKTKLVGRGVEEFAPEDLIPQESTVITLTQKGFIKRLKPSIYKIQKRGGKGVLGQRTEAEDVVQHLIFAKTHDDLLFFTDSGKVFQTKAYEIPEAKRVARGKSLLNFLELSSGEKVLDVSLFDKKDETNKYFVMATKDGIIKKTALSEFENLRRNGLIAINLKAGDALRKVQKTSGEDEIILITKLGKSIRFKEKAIRSMGRPAAGVKGVRLVAKDEVIGMAVARQPKINPPAGGRKAKIKNYLLVVSQYGYGKRTEIDYYRIQRRGGTGIKTANLTVKTGYLVAGRLLSSEKRLVAISQKGHVIKIEIDSISKMGRATQGVRIMRLDKGDQVASITCF